MTRQIAALAEGVAVMIAVVTSVGRGATSDDPASRICVPRRLLGIWLQRLNNLHRRGITFIGRFAHHPANNRGKSFGKSGYQLIERLWLQSLVCK